MRTTIWYEIVKCNSFIMASAWTDDNDDNLLLKICFKGVILSRFFALCSRSQFHRIIFNPLTVQTNPIFGFSQTNQISSFFCGLLLMELVVRNICHVLHFCFTHLTEQGKVWGYHQLAFRGAAASLTEKVVKCCFSTLVVSSLPTTCKQILF